MSELTYDDKFDEMKAREKDDYELHKIILKVPRRYKMLIGNDMVERLLIKQEYKYKYNIEIVSDEVITKMVDYEKLAKKSHETLYRTPSDEDRKKYSKLPSMFRRYGDFEEALLAKVREFKDYYLIEFHYTLLTETRYIGGDSFSRNQQLVNVSKGIKVRVVEPHNKVSGTELWIATFGTMWEARKAKRWYWYMRLYYELIVDEVCYPDIKDKE